jgi:hypothetical protein
MSTAFHGEPPFDTARELRAPRGVIESIAGPPEVA